ncbi:MAG TPA: hypothetical protein VFT20_10390, partial [Candidatus Limnocylindrales bacterium]|nr:hypothetical protein [Candidatus Limnocylindrales bacterium]
MNGRRLLAMLLAAACLGVSAPPAAGREPVVGGSVHWTPLDPADIHSRATLAPFAPLAPRPF